MIPGKNSHSSPISIQNELNIEKEKKGMKKVKSIQIKGKFKRKLLRMNTINSQSLLKVNSTKFFPFLNKLVSTPINDPQIIFDEEFFNSESPLKRKSKKLNYKEKLKNLMNEKSKQCQETIQKSHKNKNLNDWSSTKELKFISGNVLMSKGNVEECEDACFIHNQAIGIADGVGGWANYGMSSADFSNELMKRCLELCTKMVQIRKFAADNIKSEEFKLKFSDFNSSVSNQIKSRRFHANSF